MEAREGIYLGLNREGTIIIAINLIIDMIAVHIWILLEMLCGHHMYLHNCRGAVVALSFIIVEGALPFYVTIDL